MRKESFQGILLGVVIMCAVFAFITIAWAAFSSTLSISGTANIKGVKWAVEFTNSKDTQIASGSSAVALTGTAATGTNAVAATSGQLAIQPGGLTVSGAIGDFMGEGDKITYVWLIQNFGNFNANLTSSDIKTENAGSSSRSLGNVSLTCTTATTGDKNSWCEENISAKLYVEAYSSGYATASPSNVISSGSGTLFSMPAADNASDNDVKVMYLVVEYIGSNATNTQETSVDDVSVSANVTFTATQDGAMVTTTVGP